MIRRNPNDDQRAADGGMPLTGAGFPGAGGSLNLSLYAPEIDCETKSMLSGEHKQTVRFNELPDIAVLKAWLADDDLQYIKVISTNIGFIRSFQKRLVREGAANTEREERGV